MSSVRDEVPRNRPSGTAANGWLVIVLGILVCVLIFRTISDTITNRPNYTPRTVTPRGDLAANEQSTIDVFQLAAPSVVYVRTRNDQQSQFRNGLIPDELSSGTGIVWDESGHIVTNLHVVRSNLLLEQTNLTVQLIDGTELDATVIGGVWEHDIAVLRVEASASQLHPITLGTSNDLQVGQRVMAIGNPFGFDHTLSTGVIGGLNRSVATDIEDEVLSGLIQTDAAINPGNSGGPLLDSAGRLIGVNTAIVSPSRASAGLGFAVPVDAVMESVAIVLEGVSKSTAGHLGVGLLGWQEAQQFRIPREIFERGPIVRNVFPTTAADDAGLRQTRPAVNIYGRFIELGDQIIGVDGEPVRTGEELREIIRSRRPGDQVTLTLIRDEQQLTVSVVLKTPTLIY